MNKNSFYFPHDYNSRNDIKLNHLIMDHGMEGVGVFWCIIEMLYEEGGKIPMECERIAFALRTQCDVVSSVIHDFNLFKIEDGFFYSESVLSRLQIREEKSKKTRESANKRWSKK